MQKTTDLLDSKGVDYTFHNYKNQGITENIIRNWFKKESWEKFINKQGLTWKKLTHDKQATLKDENSAIKLMIENPSMIRRPIIENGSQLIVGMDEEKIQELTEA